ATSALALLHFLTSARHSTEPGLFRVPCHSADSAVGYAWQILSSILNWISVLFSTTPTTLYLALGAVQSTLLMLCTSLASVLSIVSPARQSPTLALVGSFLALFHTRTPTPTHKTSSSTTTPMMMPTTFPAPPFFTGGGTGPPGKGP